MFFNPFFNVFTSDYMQGAKGDKGETGPQGVSGNPGKDVGVFEFCFVFICHT